MKLLPAFLFSFLILPLSPEASNYESPGHDPGLISIRSFEQHKSIHNPGFDFFSFSTKQESNLCEKALKTKRTGGLFTLTGAGLVATGGVILGLSMNSNKDIAFMSGIFGGIIIYGGLVGMVVGTPIWVVGGFQTRSNCKNSPPISLSICSNGNGLAMKL